MVCCRARDEAVGWDLRGGSGEGLQLAYLFSWSVHPVYSHGMAADVGGWYHGMSWAKKGWRRRSS